MNRNIVNAASKLKDHAEDAWVDITSDQTDRTGHAAARVHSALRNGVHPKALAVQMTENSKQSNPDDPTEFTEADVHSIAKFHNSNRTRTVLTKAQTHGMIRHQRPNDNERNSSKSGVYIA